MADALAPAGRIRDAQTRVNPVNPGWNSSPSFFRAALKCTRPLLQLASLAAASSLRALWGERSAATKSNHLFPLIHPDRMREPRNNRQFRLKIPVQLKVI